MYLFTKLNIIISAVRKSKPEPNLGEVVRNLILKYLTLFSKIT